MRTRLLIFCLSLSAFAAQAQNRLNSLLSRTKILVFASHSVELIKSWCNKGALLEHGQIKCLGPIADVLEV